MKCTLCKEKIETTFLEKPLGTSIKGKWVCRDCQKKYKDTLKERI